MVAEAKDVAEDVETGEMDAAEDAEDGVAEELLENPEAVAPRSHRASTSRTRVLSLRCKRKRILFVAVVESFHRAVRVKHLFCFDMIKRGNNTIVSYRTSALQRYIHMQT